MKRFSWLLLALLCTVFAFSLPTFVAKDAEGAVDTSGYYYSQLTDAQQDFYAALDDFLTYDNLSSGVNFVCVSGSEGIMTASEVESFALSQDANVFVDFYNARKAYELDNPQLFYVDFDALDLKVTTLGGQYNLLIGAFSQNLLLCEVSELPALVEQFNTTLSSAMSTILASTGSIYKVKAIYDTLSSSTVAEDVSGLYSTAYGALVLGEADSEGLAKAFKLLCVRCSIPSTIERGINFSSGTKVCYWNCCKISSLWQMVDVTVADYGAFLLGLDDFDKNYVTSASYMSGIVAFYSPTLYNESLGTEVVSLPQISSSTKTEYSVAEGQRAQNFVCAIEPALIGDGYMLFASVSEELLSTFSAIKTCDYVFELVCDGEQTVALPSDEDSVVYKFVYEGTSYKAEKVVSVQSYGGVIFVAESGYYAVVSVASEKAQNVVDDDFQSGNLVVLSSEGVQIYEAECGESVTVTNSKTATFAYLNGQAISLGQDDLTIDITCSSTLYLGFESDQSYSQTYGETVQVYPIVSSPTSVSVQLVTSGNGFTLLATYSSLLRGTVSYQWYHEGEAVAGATGASYEGYRDDEGIGSYYVEVTISVDGVSAKASSDSISVSKDSTSTVYIVFSILAIGVAGIYVIVYLRKNKIFKKQKDSN